MLTLCSSLIFPLDGRLVLLRLGPSALLFSVCISLKFFIYDLSIYVFFLFISISGNSTTYVSRHVSRAEGAKQIVSLPNCQM